MADPRFGTTGGHLAAMKAYWTSIMGAAYYTAFLEGLAANNVRLLPSGNAGVVRAVADGEADLGLTDTDDVWAAQAIQVSGSSSSATTDWPHTFRDSENRWYGFAARARVIVYAPDRVAENELPDTWMGLCDERLKGRIVMADPRFGTTGGPDRHESRSAPGTRGSLAGQCVHQPRRRGQHVVRLRTDRIRPASIVKL